VPSTLALSAIVIIAGSGNRASRNSRSLRMLGPRSRASL
jgi:hypothetical protein